MLPRDKIFLRKFLQKYVKKLDENTLSTEEVTQIKNFFLEMQKPYNDSELTNMLFLGFLVQKNTTV
jgi:hypothetical protein